MSAESPACTVPLATYKTTDIPPDCLGNPFIEALDLFRPVEQIIETLSQAVHLEPSQRLLPAGTRENLTRNVGDLFVPLPRDYDLWRRLAKAMCASYLARAKNDPRYFDKLLNSRTPVYFGAKTFKSSFIILEGASRAGKSESLDHFLQAIPSVIQHTHYNGKQFHTKQVPWIKIEFPESRADKDIPREIILQLCILLEMTPPSDSMLTKGGFINSVARQFAVHGVGLLVLDDCEHLDEYTDNQRTGTFNFLFRLCAMIGVAVVCVGTELLLKVLATSEPLKNRSIRYPLPRWESLSDQDWDEYVEALWNIQYTKSVTPLTKHLSEHLRKLSNGLPGIASPIFEEAQGIAIIRDGYERDTEDISINLLNEALTNLRLVDKEIRDATSEPPSQDNTHSESGEERRPVVPQEPAVPVLPDLQGQSFITEISSSLLKKGVAPHEVLELFNLQPPADLLEPQP